MGLRDLVIGGLRSYGIGKLGDLRMGDWHGSDGGRGNGVEEDKRI